MRVAREKASLDIVILILKSVHGKTEWNATLLNSVSGRNLLLVRSVCTDDAEEHRLAVLQSSTEEVPVDFDKPSNCAISDADANSVVLKTSENKNMHFNVLLSWETACNYYSM
jgi:hypothetical protein